MVKRGSKQRWKVRSEQGAACDGRRGQCKVMIIVCGCNVFEVGITSGRFQIERGGREREVEFGPEKKDM
jgi:hypothetical protein